MIGRPFQKGQSGNPAGKPKGCRDKLGERFLRDLLADWEAKSANGKAQGVEALAAAREADPNAYCAMVAKLLPKDVNLNVNASEALLDALRALSDGVPAPLPDGQADIRSGGVAGHA